jgi:hypothetical protein
MVFAPVDPAIKEKIITAYLSGFGINRIVRDLHKNGIKVSHGSVCNIVRKYKQSQPLQLKETSQPQQEESKDFESKTTSINKTPPLIVNNGNLSSAITSIGGDRREPVKGSGSPLASFFLSSVEADTAVLGVNSSTGITTSANHPLSALKTLPEPIFDSDGSEPTADDDDDAILKAPESESELKQINDINNVNTHLNIIEEDAPLEEEAQEQCKLKQSEHHKPESPIKIPAAEDSPRTSEDRETETSTPGETVEDSEIETSPPSSTTIDTEQPVESSNSEINWDSDENWHRRFWSRILEEKLLIKQQRQELAQITQELQIEKQQLQIVRQNLDRQKSDLQAREVELQQTSPLARQLLSMQVNITNFLPWAEFVHEYAANQNTDLTTAAFNIVKNLRAYKELEVLQRNIQQIKQHIQQLLAEKNQTEQQLAMLNMSTARQQKAIATLIDLQAAGFSENQIAELIGLVNMWNRLPDTGVNIFGQRNGGGSSGNMSKKN